ncbi:MlaD family protein [Arvimicrobium flavum]|uniref:MlaD family protein n=1 Tax=Arvimicrobium flavum TaxID=3393320 RepID=UPI00237B8EAD|nr:MlaD family protein [Mesorhizobium shangrilense]
METKANYVAVGIFTLLAAVAAFAFVYWTAGVGERGETAALRVLIPGSASGLGRGSAVLFNGIKVGDVQRVYIDPKNPNAAIADTLIDRNTPLTRSTQADIGLAGLTGQANVELKGGNAQEMRLLDEAEEAGVTAEISANPSAVTNLLQTAQTIFTRADNVLNGLEGFVKEARGPLTDTVKNAEKFSQALANNSDGVDRFLDSVSTLSTQLQAVSGQLDSTLKSAKGLIDSVDREQVAQIVRNTEALTRNLNETGARLDGVVSDVQGAVKSINEFAGNARSTLEKVDGIVASVDPNDVKQVIADVKSATSEAGKAITNFRSASESANRAATDVSKFTDRFSRRSEDIDKIVSDAQQFAERINKASVRVDGILAKLDGLLGDENTQSVMVDLRETLNAYKKVADTLNARMGTITDNLARFSSQGLRNVEAFVSEGRRSISRIEQAITDFERNPQRIISGGEGDVRQYDGRARR